MEAATAAAAERQKEKRKTAHGTHSHAKGNSNRKIVCLLEILYILEKSESQREKYRIHNNNNTAAVVTCQLVMKMVREREWRLKSITDGVCCS